MRFLQKTKDGGKDSTVDAYFLIEIKSLFSIALLKFNKGGREAYHTHAFDAWTWFLSGSLLEKFHKRGTKPYQRSWLPKVTPKRTNHRVVANRTSWALTIRGPWDYTWTEDLGDKHTVFTHGRKEL